MANNINVNGRTAVHAGSQGVLTTVDVCKTPGKCRPVAYTNVARSTDSARTATTVFVNGNPICHKQSIFAVSSGDEPGRCGGVRSGTIKGKAEFLTASPNVFVEGKPVVRQFDLMVSNNRNTPPAPLQQPPAGEPVPLSEADMAAIEAQREAEYALWTNGEEIARLQDSGHAETEAGNT